ncbi:MAG TPA: lysylphosphatidylglycerol synthase transmembrane domain-containing protein [Thermotogota bacterium]|nr:lysylphosphatidylglycerol synthase transmembrane domain-containing protein [Thermotogota bacterium]
MKLKWNKKIVYPLFSLTIISLIAISIITSAYGLDQILNAMREYPFFFFLLAFILYLCRWVLESLSFRISTCKYHHLSFYQCFQTVVVTQFTNMITPFMSGGQPATLLILSRFGMDIASSFSSMFIKSMMYQFFLSLSGFLALLTIFNDLDTLSKNAAIIGILINLSIVFSILLIGISESLANRLIGFFIKFMKKIKVFRLKDEIESALYKNIRKFNVAFKEFRFEKKRLICLFFTTGFQFTLFNLCAFVILNGFGDFFNYKIFARLVLINTSALIVPTPGNSGGAEGLYAIFLNGLIPDGMMGAGILMWRLVVFYLPVIITGILTFFISVNLMNQKSKN